MTFSTAAASACSACYFFSVSKSFNATASIAEQLSAFPARKTAYKIGVLCTQTCFFGMGLNSLAVCGGSIYSMATGQLVFSASSLFMRTLVASGALSLGMLVISFPCILYARAWQIYQEP